MYTDQIGIREHSYLTVPQGPVFFALPRFYDLYHFINLLTFEVNGFRFVCHYYHCYYHHGMSSFPKQISSHFDGQPLLSAVEKYEDTVYSSCF